MTHFEAIIGTPYYDEEPKAVAKAMYQLSPIHMEGPPIEINIYGGDGEQQIGVGVVFETDASYEQILDCGAESVMEVPIQKE